MDYSVNIVWHHELGTDRMYFVGENENIRDALIDFLEVLHFRRSTIVSSDSQTADLAIQKNQRIQGDYEKRRKELLANPRLVKVPWVVYISHKTTEGYPDINEYTKDRELFESGAKKGVIVDLQGMEEAIVEELKKYESLAELFKDTKVSYAGNLGIFFPRVNHIDASSVENMTWQSRLALEFIGATRGQGICLEECLNNNWNMTPREIDLPMIPRLVRTTAVPQAYIVLGSFKDRPKYVRIAMDGPDYGKENRIGKNLIDLQSKIWELFQIKMGWLKPGDQRMIEG